jgi:multidrug efflux pump
MALTIMGGLFAATLLTLLFLPALTALWFGVKPARRVARAGRASAGTAPFGGARPQPAE